MTEGEEGMAAGARILLVISHPRSKVEDEQEVGPAMKS